MKSIYFLIVVTSLLGLSFSSTANDSIPTRIDEDALNTMTTSVNEEENTSTLYADSISFLRKAPHWLKVYLSSLMKGNIDRTHEKTVDMGFAITPSYTREASFGIGGAATGLYRINKKDSIQEPSDFFVCLNVSFNGFFVLTMKGNNLFTDNRSRLSYKIELYRKDLNFWGITSEETARNPKSKYDRRQVDIQAEYIYKITRNFFAGVQFRSDYTDAYNVENPEYLLGDRPQYYVTGLGLSLEFDTRDNLVTPTRGIYVAYKPMLFPAFLSDAPATFHSHTIVFNAYQRIWQDALLAFDFYTKINSAATPWTMREMIASDGVRMRGYYMGSYIDNNQIEAQVELRQHIWGRFGAVAWVGAATIFSEFKEFREKNIRPEWLYNFGLGLRFEFKHNVNARIDYGFGKHTSGLIFAIGEAF